MWVDVVMGGRGGLLTCLLMCKGVGVCAKNNIGKWQCNVMGIIIVVLGVDFVLWLV